MRITLLVPPLTLFSNFNYLQFNMEQQVRKEVNKKTRHMLYIPPTTYEVFLLLINAGLQKEPFQFSH